MDGEPSIGSRETPMNNAVNNAMVLHYSCVIFMRLEKTVTHGKNALKRMGSWSEPDSQQAGISRRFGLVGSNGHGRGATWLLAGERQQ